MDSGKGHQLMLTEEEWKKKENSDGKLLLTREELLKMYGKGGSPVGGRDYRVRDTRIVRDRSQVRCFNCGGYGHFAAKCRKHVRSRHQRGKINLTQTNDNEPALLMAMCDNSVQAFTEEKGVNNSKEVEEKSWYLDKGANNHMIGHREKFERLDRTMKCEVKFGDGSLVKIEGKGSIRIACKNGETRILQGVFYSHTSKQHYKPRTTFRGRT